MKEREVRARIEQFLRTAARNVVVPASLGLGLTASGCESSALHAGAADAGHDLAAQVSDAVVSSDIRDVAAELPLIAPPYLLPPPPPDAASATDLPLMAVPYLVALPRDDAAPDQSPDSLESEAGAQAPDAGADAYVPVPPVIYMVFIQPPAESESAGKPAPDASQEVAADPVPQQKV